MKGRLLFALLFVCLLALGIASLNDMQATAASLPPEVRAAAFVPSLPDPAQKETPAPLSPEKAVLHKAHCFYQPLLDSCIKEEAPPLLQSFYRAFYQAFHYSDRAG